MGELANEHVELFTLFIIIYFLASKTVKSSLTANPKLFF
jgi:uncharacterized protein YneF (UPF0154 family)